MKNVAQDSGHLRPRVVNVDGNPSYPKVVPEIKQEPRLGRRRLAAVRCESPSGRPECGGEFVLVWTSGLAQHDRNVQFANLIWVGEWVGLFFRQQPPNH